MHGFPSSLNTSEQGWATCQSLKELNLATPLPANSLPGPCPSTAVSGTQPWSFSLNKPVLVDAPVGHSEMLCKDLKQL